MYRIRRVEAAPLDRFNPRPVAALGTPRKRLLKPALLAALTGLSAAVLAAPIPAQSTMPASSLAIGPTIPPRIQIDQAALRAPRKGHMPARASITPFSEATLHLPHLLAGLLGILALRRKLTANRNR